MKLKTLLFCTFAALSLLAQNAQAAVVGYVNSSFQAGDNWFGNPLFDPPNMLSSLIPTAPVGTTVSLWDSTSDQYATTATWNGTVWSTDFLLSPGTGALLHTPSSFINTFMGTVLDLDGSVWAGGDLTEPAPFSGPNGLYLFTARAPIALSGHVFDPALGQYDVFESILGRAPHNGEQVITLNPLTQTYVTTTFSGGVWDNGDPSLGVGQAAMFNIGAVPEPSTLGLLFVGVAVTSLARRQVRR